MTRTVPHRLILSAVLTLSAIVHLSPIAQTLQTTRTAPTMATTVYALTLRTSLAGVANVNYDMSTGFTGSGQYYAQFWPTAGATKVPIQNTYQFQAAAPSSPSGLSYQWLSYRLANNVTLAGTTVTIQHAGRLYATFNAAQATFRFELSKMTSSGSVETLLGTVTEPAVASTETNELANYSVNMTITPLTLAAGERFVLRAFLVPAPGQTMVAQASPLRLSYGTSSSGLTLNLGFTDTFTFTPNTTRMYPRRTSTIAIGNFFDFLNVGVNQAAATAVVTTTSGGGVIQWTRTAGGTPLEWISQRLTQSWQFDSPDPAVPAINANMNLAESATTVNAAGLLRLYRWRAGVETQFYEYAGTVELTTTTGTAAAGTTTALAGQTLTPMAFQPDDRLVVRWFVTPVPGQTMGAGTATLTYDAHPGLTDKGYVDLYDLPVNPFKAETDPATPATVPNSGMKMGIQN